MHTHTSSHRSIFPLVTLLGRMPKQGEDIELLIKEAIEGRADKHEKEIECAFQLCRNTQGQLTGEVELFPFHPQGEEEYVEERLSAYEDDPLYADVLCIEQEERHYQQVQAGPGGDATVSYLVSTQKVRI